MHQHIKRQAEDSIELDASPAKQQEALHVYVRRYVCVHVCLHARACL